MTLVRTAAALMAATFALGALAAGNTTNEDFRDSKKMLERKVYFDHRVTLYCGYAFDKQKNVSLPAGFVAPQHKERAGRVEWEHVVPAENFGRAFKEWREGDGRCTNEKGHFYKGRRCAEKMSAEYRLMQADMYNLFPAVGAVNAIRSNYNYELLPGVPNTFGTCEMKIDGRRAEPPERSRGEIARAIGEELKAGTIRAWGVSNYSAEQLSALLAAAREENIPLPSMCQPPLSLLNTGALDALLPLCAQEGIGVIPYQVLQGGILTGKYHAGQQPPAGSRAAEKPDWMKPMTDEVYATLARVEAEAKAVGQSMTQYALAWALRRPAVRCVLLGVKRRAQLEEAAAIF